MNNPEKTPQEINVEVAEVLGLDYSSAADGLVSVIDSSGWPEIYNPCENPIHFWPLVEGYDIHVSPEDWHEDGSKTWVAYYLLDQCLVAEAHDKSPGRAICLCFLKLMEGE